MALTDQQTQLAQELLTTRPAVIPGTRAIIDDGQRKAWFDDVVAAMKDNGITDDAAIATFCDLAGVPD